MEYAHHEMQDPILMDGTSEMHARNELNHILNEQWQEALKDATIAAEQRSRWQPFSEIVMRIHEAAAF
jgi:hypothetical protein